jgi:hypothetical protein
METADPEHLGQGNHQGRGHALGQVPNYGQKCEDGKIRGYTSSWNAQRIAISCI